MISMAIIKKVPARCLIIEGKLVGLGTLEVEESRSRSISELILKRVGGDGNSPVGLRGILVIKKFLRVDREDATKSGVGGGHTSKGNDCVTVT